MALDAIQQPELTQIERIGEADVVVGILDSDHKRDVSATIGMVREAVGKLSNAVRMVVVCNNGMGDPSLVSADSVDEHPSPHLAFLSLAQPESGRAPFESLSQAYHRVLAIGGKLGARACGVIGSEPRSTAAQSVVYLLVQPLLDMGFDLVMPRYSRLKTEGLLNRSILAPLSRALYGERLQNPMGPDFAVSGRLLQRIVAQDEPKGRGYQGHPVASLASTAIGSGFQICESYLGTRSQPATNWVDLDTLLALILGPVFVDVERNAAFWQRVRGSKPVHWFGSVEPPSGEGGGVDVQRMFETFQLGTQNLQDIWGTVLPPRTLLELRKLARLPPAEFRMPDDLWACIVYDFALGHRLRIISRDHLLRSMTPLYLGWIVSYANELESAGPAEVESRLERLSTIFEARKPYLLSRWRWPDRFNP
jgi:hypothetical protein